jgi:glucose-1-phosphate cytidylyltransferase
MKAVLLAGGMGTRMREETEFRPKPMVEIGGKPILWHLMKIFAHHGITDFVICVGYKGEQIKDYFLNYAARNNDFTIRLGKSEVVSFHGDHGESDWTVTIADTGAATMTAGRALLERRAIHSDLRRRARGYRRDVASRLSRSGRDAGDDQHG